MPATRSSSKSVRRQLSPEISSHRKPLRVVRNEAEVIVLSSDDEQRVPVPRKKAERVKSQTKPLIPFGEIVEVSSDDEAHVSPKQRSIMTDVRKQLKELQHENVKLEQELVQTRQANQRLLQEIAELRVKQGPESGKLVLDSSQLDDIVNCEICTTRIWTPFILPECGHTFCRSCLQDWFGTALKQHIASHPHYDINQPLLHIPAYIRNVMQNPQLMRLPHIAALVSQYKPPQPHYTCPTCRETVQNKPVEDFALKALVRMVAAAGGETSPKKESIELGTGRKGKAPATKSKGPWDSFFLRA